MKLGSLDIGSKLEAYNDYIKKNNSILDLIVKEVKVVTLKGQMANENYYSGT